MNRRVALQKLALITGGTAGIGLSTAKLLASNNYNLLLTGRRADRLKEIKKNLEQEFSVQVSIANFDISKRLECEAFIKNNSDLLGKLNVLINNAGLAKGVDPIQSASLDDWESMVDTNIKGLFFVTRLCLPFLEANSDSHIINISSVAGKWVYPGGGVYCSTKHAVSAFSEGLRMDLHGKGIRVTSICPGLVETEFSKVRMSDEQKANEVYKGMTPLTADDIAASILWSLQRPKHVNIQEMTIFPTDQASVNLVHRT